MSLHPYNAIRAANARRQPAGGVMIIIGVQITQEPKGT
jgi:hypothetical protein